MYSKNHQSINLPSSVEQYEIIVNVYLTINFFFVGVWGISKHNPWVTDSATNKGTGAYRSWSFLSWPTSVWRAARTCIPHTYQSSSDRQWSKGGFRVWGSRGITKS